MSGARRPPPAHPALRLWLGWAELLRRYHRFETEGLHHLDGPRSALIVGYHGRAAAWDLVILNKLLWERHGRIPMSFIHSTFDAWRPLRWMKEGLDFVTGDDPAALQRVIDEGRHIILLPGANREANRSWRVRYRVDWGQRVGYLRLALRHDLPLVPVAASGVDDTYIGLNDGYRLGKRLGLPHQIPAWLALGPLGIQPLSPAFPVRIRQRIGAPIHLRATYGDLDPDDRQALIPVSQDVQARVQAMLDALRAG